MKLLYLPLLYEGQNNEQKYLEKAFRKRFKVEVFDFYNFKGDRNEEFLRIVQTFKPDVIHCQFQGTRLIEPFTIGHVKLVYPKTIITQWTGDVRPEPLKEYVEYSKFCDLSLVVSLTSIRQYMEAGAKKVAYWQNAISVPEQIGKPAKNPKGIIFCGGKYTTFPNSQNRIELIERFKKEFGRDFEVYGFGWQSPPKMLPWDDQTKTYQSKYLILGQNNVADHEWWFSDRQLIAMASGRPHLCQYSKNLEELFDNGKECVWYKSIDEAVELAKFLLKNPEIAEYIGRKGQEKVAAIYNWDVKVKEYIKMILELKK